MMTSRWTATPSRDWTAWANCEVRVVKQSSAVRRSRYKKKNQNNDNMEHRPHTQDDDEDAALTSHLDSGNVSPGFSSPAAPGEVRDWGSGGGMGIGMGMG